MRQNNNKLGMVGASLALMASAGGLSSAGTNITIKADRPPVEQRISKKRKAKKHSSGGKSLLQNNWSPEYVRKQRQKNGVGKPSAAQARNMNAMYDKWASKKEWYNAK